MSTTSEETDNVTHTPGPWRQLQPPILRTGRIVEGYGIRIADVMERHALLTPEQCKANACLIAAAPELLKALKMLCSSIEWEVMAASPSEQKYGETHRFIASLSQAGTVGGSAEAMTMAKAAIAKAEGRE